MPSPCAALDVGALLEQRAHRVAVAAHRGIRDRRVEVAAPSERGHGQRQRHQSAVEAEASVSSQDHAKTQTKDSLVISAFLAS